MVSSRFKDLRPVRPLVSSLLSSLLFLLALVAALPRRADAYVDPGSGAMLWQVIAAAAIGSLFYLRKFANWVRARLHLKSNRALGFVFATCYAITASPLVLRLFGGQPMPRFNDIFLVGIVLTVYLFAWEPAIYLFLISLAISAWILPPGGSFRVESPADFYRMVSFSIVSVFLIVLLSRHRAQKELPEIQANRTPARRANQPVATEVG